MKKRKQITRELPYKVPDCLLEKFVQPIPRNQDSPPQILALLKSLGAPAMCHVISEGKLDGRDMELLETLEAIVGYGIGTIISCNPGRLAYVETEDVRLLVRR